MIASGVLAGGLVGCLTGAAYIRCRQGEEVSAAKKDSYYLIRERLGHYAAMKSSCATIYHPPAKSTHFVPTAYLLDERQHDILLGVLKKVEAKSAAVAVVAVLAFDLIAGTVSDVHNPFSRFLIGEVAGLLVAALVFSLDAASHLGQPDYRRMLTRPKKPIAEIRGRELQRDLVHDALRKEAGLHAFFGLTVVSIALLGIFFLVDFFSDPNTCPSELPIPLELCPG